jgi:hypothetical protein
MKDISIITPYPDDIISSGKISDTNNISMALVPPSERIMVSTSKTPTKNDKSENVRPRHFRG